MQILEALSYCRARSVELKLDGDRLKLIGSKEAVDDKLLALVRQNKAGLIQLLQAREEGRDAGLSALDGAARALPQLASYNQQRLWFMEQLSAADGAYNGASALELHGRLDRAALAGALDQLVARHESLRTVFVDRDGQPWQQVQPPARAALSEVAGLHGAALDSAMRGALATPFDLARDTMLRATLYLAGPDHHVLLLVMHHIASDAWSQQILVRDFCELYNAGAGGRPARLAAPAFQYLDYAAWERGRLQGPLLASKLGLWRDYLQDAPRLHALPCDMARRSDTHGAAARLAFQVAPAQVAQLRQIASDCQSTMFCVLAALYSVLLHQLGDEPDVVFGMPVANRTRPELDDITGYFSNTVVLRNRLPRDYTLREAIALTRANLDFVLAHQDVPFDMLVDELKLERDPSFSPLYQLWFSLHEGRKGGIALDGIDASLRAIERSAGRYDLKLEAELDGEQLTLAWEYDSALFDGDTIVRFERCFDHLLRQFGADPERKLSQLAPAAAPAPAPAAAAAPMLLPLCWDESVARDSARPGLLGAHGLMSVGEADERAARLAGLLAELGLGAGDRVGVCVACSPAALVATLALWRLGAVCVPLAPGMGAPELGALAALAGIGAVLASAAAAATLALGSLELVLLDGLEQEDWLADYAGAPARAWVAAPDAAACLLAASGGGLVQLSHASLAHDVEAVASRYAMAPGLRYAYTPVPGALFFNSMLLLALGRAGSLHVLPAPALRDAAAMRALLATQAIDVLELTPSRHNAWSGAGTPVLPRAYLFLAGEALPAGLPALLAGAADPAGCRIIARHGWPEAGMGCLSHELGVEEASVGELGRPLGMHQVLLLQGERAAPAGAWGELAIAGPGLASAGLGQAAPRFGTALGLRVYRTGIRARLDSAGELAFGGCMLQAVQWRGFRVCAHDSEAALRRLPGVSACSVAFDAAAGTDGALVAHVVSDVDPALLLQQLKGQLPHYLVPRAIVAMDALPLDADGVLARAELAPVPGRAAQTRAPASALEQQLAAVWCELLGREHVAAGDNFFDLGGHSLLATRLLNRVRSRIWSGLTLQAIFASPVLADLAQHIAQHQAAPHDGAPAIVARGAGVPAPLSYSQQQLWTIDRIGGGSSHYNMVAAYRLQGALDRDALAGALHALVERHAALRTRFAEHDGVVLQQAAHAWSLALEQRDYSALAGAEQQQRLDAERDAEAAHRFDLGAGLLLRAKLIALGADDAQLILNIHHIACDGWSVALLMAELQQLYLGSAGQPPAPLRIGYGDYAAWQRSALSAEPLAAASAFWRAELDGAAPLHGLVPDFSRPAVADHRGAELIDWLDRAQLDAVRQLARQAGTTLFICLESLFALFIARLSGSADVVIGCAVAGRAHIDTEPLVGLFANLIALRHRIDFTQPLLDYVAAAHVSASGALAHQQMPFELLVETLKPQRSLASHPLFQIAFGLRQAAPRRMQLGDVLITQAARARLEVKFDLMLSAEESEDGLRLEWQYASALFGAARVQAMAGQFKTMLAALASSHALGVGSLPLLADADRAFLARHAPGPDAAPCSERIDQRFARMAHATPQALALRGEADCVTYAALEQMVAVTAARLAGQGVGAGDMVALQLARGPALVACLLAIGRLGAVYVPLDTSYPAARIAAIAADCGARLLLADTGAPLLPPGHGTRQLSLAELAAGPSAAVAPLACQPEQAAYVMYTSGSTGAPKGVVVPQRAVLRLVDQCSFMPLDGATVMLQLASVAFDASTLELWGPLLNGGTLAIYPDQVLELGELSAFLARHQVNSLWLTAALFEQWAHHLDRPLPQLRHVLAGGDVLSPAAVRCLYGKLDQVTIINGYGPTENTTFTCCHAIARDWPLGLAVPIGVPIGGTGVAVLDARGALLPPGATGELYASGAGLALGYLNQAALTAEKFVAVGQVSMYRTGDLVRWRADGTLQYLGRADSQVKLRGYRIEPGEIERCLMQHPAVDEACVVLAGGPEPRLLAYFTSATASDALRAQLRSHAQQFLPAYMVPQALVQLARLPLNANGKIERAALPPPQAGDYAGGSNLAPQGPLELRLAALWQDLLRLDTVGAGDDFFELGGNSLLAIRLAAALEADAGLLLPVRVVFQSRTLRGIAEWLAAHGAAPDQGAGCALAPVARDLPIAASYAQQRLWFIDRVEGGSSQYNMPARFDLDGSLDLALLESVLATLVQRHEVMRTSYAEIDGVACQVIAQAAPAALRCIDLRELAESERAPAADAILAQDAIAPFDLARGPVFRVTLVRLSEAAYRMQFNMHHIASDGWSVGVLMRELAALYGGATLAPLTHQYAEYAHWQRARLTGAARQSLAAYWRTQLADLPQLHSLPLDRPRPARMTTRGALLRTRAAAPLARALNGLARSQNVSLFMLLQSSLALLLARVSGESEVVIGTPVAGRERREFEALVGCFVNTLVLRNRVPQQGAFTDFLGASRAMLLDAFEHQQLPFDMLVEELNPARSASHLPLFQLWFVLQNMDVGTLALPQLSIAEVARAETSAKFDLMLTATERADGIDFNWVYNSDLFDAATIAAWSASFSTLLAAIVATPDADLGLLDLLDGEQRATLARLGAGVTAPPAPDTVFAQFARQARATPERTALRFGADALSYGALAGRAARLAGYLAEIGVRPGALVGVCCPRSLEQVIAVLGIWQAGAAFVPLDPQAPRARLAHMVADAGAAHVLAMGAAADSFDLSQVDLLLMDGAAAGAGWLDGFDAAEDLSRLDGLAYVMYTSGTSGLPKGVLIGHDNLANLAQGLDLVLAEHGVPLAPVWAWNAPLVFDASLQGLSRLGCGAELHILSDALRTSPERLVDYLAQHGIAMLDCTPSLLALVQQEAQRRACPLPHLLVGGEPIDAAQWQAIAAAMAAAGRVALNVYGPTETTVNASWAQIAPGTTPSIGRPWPNLSLQVLDARLQPVPPGALGECCIGGAGVARGYLNRPELERERFVAPAGQARYYRSGDLVRWLGNGQLSYLQRRDGQVKLRGYRIELGEIEQVLRAHAAVEAAAVIVAAGALVAYVTGASPAAAELAAHCRAVLPEYMVPVAFIGLEQLPLTANGKLDLRALPQLAAHAPASERAPSGTLETALAAIWSRILGCPVDSAEASFFALGGHSLLAIRVISAVREQFGVELALAEFFRAPTVGALAAAIGSAAPQRRRAALRARPDARWAPLSMSQQRLWLIDRLEGGSTQYNMPAAFLLEGQFDQQACQRSVALIVERHAVLRSTYAEVDGAARQHINPAPALALPLHDLGHLAGPAQEAEVRALAGADAARCFDLGADLMLRVQLLRLAPQRHVLLFNMHHIASDGWSVGLLIGEFCSAYAAFAAGAVPALAPLALQYADYAHWQREVVTPEVLAPQLDYWQRQLAVLPQVHSLPLDKPRPVRQTYHGAVLVRRIGTDQLGALKQLSLAHQATLFMTLQAALAALIGRWSNEHDIVIGTPAAGRDEQALEPLIGFFLNTLVLRTDLSANPPFDQLLAQTRATVLAAFEHQEVPFELLVEALKPERSLSHPALFQIMFMLQNHQQGSFAMPGLAMTALERPLVMAKFDLQLSASEDQDGLQLTWNYNTDLFEAATIARMADGYQQILLAITAAPATRVEALNLLPAAEAEKILRQWNATGAALPYERGLHDPFVEQVRASPDAVAVIDQHGSATYAELFAHAAALAQALAPYTVRPETLVAVLLPKGRLQLVATLGIMMAGGAYLPLDTGWPAARIDQVLAHGQAGALVALPALCGALSHPAARIDLATLAPLAAPDAARALAGMAPCSAPASLAYVIFTSGSTGKPKGVAIEHRSALNTIVDINQRYRVTAADAVLAVSALSFDLSVYDMFGLLAVGGRVVFPDEARQKDPQHWAELVELHGISLWDSVPASADLLTAQYEWRQRSGGGALRILMMSGDWIAPTLPARIAAVFPGVAIHSLGGATEGSIWSISYPILEDTSLRKSVPYGKPLANQAFYILSADMAPCPVGVVGELHIGGLGVAREYYGDPERTAASYVVHTGLNDRLYKTGDMGRYMADGNIEFVGRKDLQVKLRGFRIELGDIEAALVRHPEVADAVVLVLRDATEVQQLVAYINPDPLARASGRNWDQLLRQHLGALVPNYMVPAYYVVLDAFPLSANNKVDRKQLPQPLWHKDDDAACAAPAGATEELLLAVWRQVLGRERIGVERNFFELGGSSVHLIEIAGRANLALGLELGVVRYFEHPTIRAMAAFIDNDTHPQQAHALAATRNKGRQAARLAKRSKP